MSEAKLWDEGRVMIRFWSKDGDGVTKVNALTFAGSLAWGRIDVSATMPALPLVAVKKVGAVPDWILAASGLLTVTDPVDDAIIDQTFWDSMQASKTDGSIKGGKP
jgi:hypothetical protein